MATDNIERTPLGWEINVLYLMLQATSILIEDIDQQLQRNRDMFNREKKMYFKNYERCVNQARHWLEEFGLDTSCWDAVGQDSRAYTNIIADANELIREVLLYIDRSHCETGYYDIMRFLRSMPENGLFPEKFIARFNFKHEWVPGKGDRVHTLNHGDGTIDLKVNDSYIINLDSGGQTVLKESHFKLI
jgi:hypothetical protein